MFSLRIVATQHLWLTQPAVHNSDLTLANSAQAGLVRRFWDRVNDAASGTEETCSRDLSQVSHAMLVITVCVSVLERSRPDQPPARLQMPELALGLPGLLVRPRKVAVRVGEMGVEPQASLMGTARSTGCFPVTRSRRSRHRAPRVRPAPRRTARCPPSRGTAPSGACPREIWARHHSGAWRPDCRRASARSHRGAAFPREGDLAVPDPRHRPNLYPFRPLNWTPSTMRRLAKRKTMRRGRALSTAPAMIGP